MNTHPLLNSPLVVICAWCAATISGPARPVSTTHRGLVSHGICETCSADVFSASGLDKA